MSDDQQSAPIIILGAPRSGTTYLNSILNAHPDIYITHETRLFVWLERALHEISQHDDALLNHRKDFIEFLSMMLPQLVRDYYWKLKPVRYWGDKNPHYAKPANREALGTIADLFPGTRFIHIVRDGRDVVTSLLRKGWVNFDRAHKVWKSHVANACDFGQTQPPQQYLELHYEDLVKDDIQIATQVFAFLGIPMHPSVHSFCQQQMISRTPMSGPTRNIHAGVRSSEWSSQLTTAEQLRSLEMLGPDLVKHGYETAESFRTMYVNIAAQHALALISHPSSSEQNTAHASRLAAACDLLPADATVLVVSKGDESLLKECGRRAWHFPQVDGGTYAGHHPADSTEAISQLEGLRRKGANYLLFPDFSRWWLDHYQGLSQHLDEKWLRILDREGVCVIFAAADHH